MLLSAMIAKVKAEGGIDAPDAVVQGWLDDRVNRLIVRSKWKQVEGAIGLTVAGQASYALSDLIVDVVEIDVDGEPYDLSTVQEIRRLKAGRARLTGPGGVFAPSFDSSLPDGNQGVQIYPVPAVSGLAINGLFAVNHPNTALGSAPPLPEDLMHGAWEGAIADGLALMDGRLADAAVWEAKFESVAVELERRRKGLIGSGPIQIRVPTY